MLYLFCNPRNKGFCFLSGSVEVCYVKGCSWYILINLLFLIYFVPISLTSNQSNLATVSVAPVTRRQCRLLGRLANSAHSNLLLFARLHMALWQVVLVTLLSLVVVNGVCPTFCDSCNESGSPPTCSIDCNIHACNDTQCPPG